MKHNPWNDLLNIPSGLCGYCKHLHRGSEERYFSCNAFPNGIPYSIIDTDHRKPFPGDNGIQFEILEGRTLAEWEIEDTENAEKLYGYETRERTAFFLNKDKPSGFPNE